MSRCDMSLRYAVLALLFLCGCKGHWEETEQTTGYKGKARVNPFLAAERMLNALGHHAHSAKAFTQLPKYQTVMFISGESGLSAGRARQLLRWVSRGGRLIYCLEGMRPYNDFQTQYGSIITAMLMEEERDPILEQLGVGVMKRLPLEELGPLTKKQKKTDKSASEKRDKSKRQHDEHDDEDWTETLFNVDWCGQQYQLSLGGRLSLILKRKLRPGEFSAGLKNESLALFLKHGNGSVTLLPHARPLRNHWIGEYDHARWLAALVGDEEGRDVLFVTATAGGFMGLLWQHGWMALVALMLLLLFWLWQQMPRFGPLTEVEVDTTRHFASHIGALGEFFWRMRRSALLVDSARDAVWERVHERHRPLDDGSRKMSGVLAEEIARRTGLPQKRVIAAFEVPAPDSAHNFVSLMRDLQAMRHAL